MESLMFVQLEKLDIGYVLTHAPCEFAYEKKRESYPSLQAALIRAQHLLDPSFDDIWK